MTIQNLWGDDLVYDSMFDNSIQTPATILKAQGAELERLTKGVLNGQLVVNKGGYDAEAEFELNFYIVAPSLDNYRYEVLAVYHYVELFPVRIIANAARQELECQDKEQFEHAVAEILRSEEVRRVVRNLISLSKAA